MRPVLGLSILGFESEYRGVCLTLGLTIDGCNTYHSVSISNVRNGIARESFRNQIRHASDTARVSTPDNIDQAKSVPGRRACRRMSDLGG